MAYMGYGLFHTVIPNIGVQIPKKEHDHPGTSRKISWTPGNVKQQIIEITSWWHTGSLSGIFLEVTI
jgi:hypothetical protein